jgi:hypothetical protein
MADSTEGPFTLFAPLRIDRNRRASDLDRFRALALPSFQKHLPPDLVHEILVVVPPEDLRQAAGELARSGPLPVRVVDETVLGVDAQDSPGWVKQQILKLAAPEAVTTSWFITIDADVVATRPVDGSFLLPDGRAIWEQERARVHWEWWENSARLLGIPVAVAPDDAVFGVTPALLNTEAVRGLWAAIESAHPGASWSRTLSDKREWGWTEYTLYWTHLVATGQAERLYSDVRRYPYALTDSVWTSAELDALDTAGLDRVFADDAEHAFYVLQSNLELPLIDTVRLLRPYLDPGAPITREEQRRWARHTRAHARLALRHRVVARLRSVLGR